MHKPTKVILHTELTSMWAVAGNIAIISDSQTTKTSPLRLACVELLEIWIMFIIQ